VVADRLGWFGEAGSVEDFLKVRRCRLTASKPVLKASTVSAIQTINIISCFELLLTIST
jgi:hypothetical protein